MIRRRRSVLILPASSRRMAEKAASLPADEVIFDLEDAVASEPAAKAGARRTLIESLRQLDFGPRHVAVRVNQVPGAEVLADLYQLVGEIGPSVGTVVVPKVQRPEQVGFVDQMLSCLEEERGWDRRLGMQLQIEDPAGLAGVRRIARTSSRIEALIFGPGDFAAAMGMPSSAIGAESPGYPGDIWHYPLFAITVAAREAGVQAIDGPCSDLHDPEALERSAQRAASLGMDGKWAIHPSQLEPINMAFEPSPDAVERAREIITKLAPAGGGAVRMGGEMIDEASRRMAQAVLARATRDQE